MNCLVCKAPVTAGARGRKPKYCGVRCRVYAHRHQLPNELTSKARWIRHKNKVPITVNNHAASSTNPATWSDYQTAKESRHGDGLGFVLSGDGITCIDLDYCYSGEPTAAAQSLIDSLPDTYIEVSPSGKGLHIWGYTDLQQGRRFTRDGLSIEIYPNGRYITMTGNALNRAPLAELDLSNIMP